MNPAQFFSRVIKPTVAASLKAFVTSAADKSQGRPVHAIWRQFAFMPNTTLTIFIND
jgi:hypothetical protein